MQISPIKWEEKIKLTSVGIPPDVYKQGNLSMESDRYICVKEAAPDGAISYNIVDISQNYKVQKKPIKADAVMMHPSRPVISTRTGGSAASCGVQIVDLAKKDTLRDVSIPEQVQMWCWVNENVVGVVGTRCVYHIDINTKPATAPAAMIFEKSDDLKKAQILNYSVDPKGKWAVLNGIYSPDKGATICGVIQLFSIEQGQFQSIEGFAPSFGELALIDKNYKNTVITFVKKKPTDVNSSVLVLEVGQPIDPSQKIKKVQAFQAAPEVTSTDFPILSYISQKFGLAYFVSKTGYLYVHELYSGCMIYRTRLTSDLVVASCRHSETDGMLCVNKKGSVLLASVDEKNLVNYVKTQCPHIPDAMGIAIKMAQFNSLPGAETLFIDQFKRYMAEGNYQTAAKVVAESPEGGLRTPETIQAFKTAPMVPGSKGQPLLQYFTYLLENNIKLNSIETMELVRPVLAQGRRDMVENWVKGDKIECSKELGDIVKPMDPQLAVSIYSKSNSPEMTVQSLAETGQYDEIIPYCKKTGYQPNFANILKRILDSGLTDKAVDFGKLVSNRGEGGKGNPAVPLNVVFDLFMQYNRIAELTQIMIVALESNRPEDGPLQSKLLELCLSRDPNLAVTIFQKRQFSYYDKQKIGKLCEQIGLLGYALENYTDIADIRRVIVNTHMLNKVQLLNFLCTLEPEKAKICLQDIIKISPMNAQLAAEAAAKLAESGALDQEDLIQMFESLGSIDGLFMYLRQVIGSSDNPEVHFKYIESATKLNKLTEVERVIRETNVYDPERVKEFLLEIRLPDPKALIFLCDAHGFLEDMTKYLYKNGFLDHLGKYVMHINQQSAPEVMGALLDIECEESLIKQYLSPVRLCPIDKLVYQFEKRNRLRVLQGWLEQRMMEGNQTTELHTALAKIYVESNKDADTFLLNNTFYDPLIVGKYCEDKEPLKAFYAYKRGKCSMELIQVTNKNMLHKLQAGYLVEMQDPELWKVVLSEENTHRKRLIEQVVQTALPDTKSPEEVSVTVKAFADAGLHHELIEILDKIVLHRTEFAQYSNLQSLLILTAIKAEPSRVMDYVNRLENYNAPKLAMKALNSGLNEEALAIYTKFGNHEEAIDVLISKIKDLSRAEIYADKVALPNIWSKLGQGYLSAEQVADAIKSFMKAGDAKSFMLVIGQAERQEKFELLIDFLLMARTKLKDAQIETAILYAYAKCNRLSELDGFLVQTNSASIETVGDRCYTEKLYEAARILYHHIGKLGKLASCLVHLGHYQAAIDAAKKADSPKTWEEVNSACVKAKQFPLAAIAGQKIIIHPDKLEMLINNYEKFGYWEELIKLLDSGLALDQTHNGIFTELGILLAKYVPTRLMDHLRTYFQRLQINKLLKACEDYQMWREAVFLHYHYNQYDSAVNIMIEHSPSAWEHDNFVQNIQKVANSDYYYRAIQFYLAEQPLLLNELLTSISNKLDYQKTVVLLKKYNAVPLVLPFLKSVQSYNVQAVNEALNDIYFECEDFEHLRMSVSEYDKIDQLALAAKLENHELVEFKRIAALLYKKNKKFKESIALSKDIEQYKDAIESAMESKNGEIAEELLRFFVSNKDKESFAACLYTCYELIEPDVVMELAWRNNLMEFAYPFFIQSMRETKLEMLSMKKKLDEIQKREEKKSKESSGFGGSDYMMPQYPQIMPSAPLSSPGMGAPGMGVPGMAGPGMGAPGMGPDLGMGVSGLGSFGNSGLGGNYMPGF